MASYWDKFSKERLQRRRVLQLAALGSTGIAAAALVGCGSDDDDDTTGSSGSTGTSGTTGAATGAASSGGTLAAEQMVRRRLTQDLIGMDPATIFRINTEEQAFQIYSALMSYGTGPDPIPDLAESYEQVDPTTVTFKLAQGVKWHKDYGELTSEDVKFSLERILDPATASSYTVNLSNVDSIDAPDASTVTIKTKVPDRHFLHWVANYHQGAIVKKQALDDLGEDYGYHPIGTGPYYFDSFVPDQEVVLQRFDDYFKGPGTLQTIRGRFIPDNETGAIAFQNEEIDVYGSTTNEETFKRLEGDDRISIKYHDNAGGPTTRLFNGEAEGLSDVRVRQAWLHAIDDEAILKATNPVTGRPWNNLLPDWMPVYNPDVPDFEYDPEKSKTLLAAAGYENGLTLPYLTTSVNAAAQFEQDYLSKAGITIEFEIVDQPTYVSRRILGDFSVAGRYYPAVNPDELLFGHYHPDYFPPNGLNVARYSNPEVTALLEKGRAEFDLEAAKPSYFEAQALATADAPYGITGWTRRLDFHFNWIEGVAANPLTNMLFYGMSVVEH